MSQEKFKGFLVQLCHFADEDGKMNDFPKITELSSQLRTLDFKFLQYLLFHGDFSVEKDSSD